MIWNHQGELQEVTVLEETCTAWEVRSYNLTQQLGETFNVPSGEFPFAILTGNSYYLFTRTCVD